MRQIVMPGDVIAEKPARVEHSYIENGKTYAGILGMFDSERNSIVPLEGAWVPRIGDKVIGVVTGTRSTVYEVDLDFFGRSILIGSKFDRHTYRLGEVIEAEVKDVEDRKTVILDRPRTLFGGTILKIKPTKVPRVIGKANTMLMQIASFTKSTIAVGNNGIVWLKGGNIALATGAIRKIEEEAHTSGLTERIKQMLEEQKPAGI
jgi:exosome complex component RRP4